MMNIGQTIRDLRIKKEIKQKDLALKSGIKPTYLSQIEKGQKTPTLDVLERISKALDIPMPILTFLSLSEDDINPDKRDSYKRIEPAIKGLIREFFLSP